MISASFLMLRWQNIPFSPIRSENIIENLRHVTVFVELEKEVAIPLALFIKKVLMGKCKGIC